MSLNSLASSRVAREVATSSQARVQGITSEDTLGPKEQDVQNALSALVEYIPAETIALYLTTVSTLPVLGDAVSWLNPVTVYWLFGILTPVLFVMIYAGKRRAAGQSRWPGFDKWPWWPMVAATIAFLVWALAVPDSPFFDVENGTAFKGWLAIVVSTLLGVAGRLFGPAPE